MIHGVNINDRNANHRINEAVHTITHHYEEWDAMAQQDAQQEQDIDAYWHAIESQVRVVLEGMVFDEGVHGPSAKVKCEYCGDWHGGVECPSPDEIKRLAEEIRLSRGRDSYPLGYPPTPVQTQEIESEPRRAGFPVSRGAP